MRKQAERMRVLRITQTAFEDLASRGGAYVVWHDPDRQGFYTPTVYLGSLGASWRAVATDALAVVCAILAGVVFGVVLS